LQLDSLTKGKLLGNCGKSKKQVGDCGSPSPSAWKDPDWSLSSHEWPKIQTIF